ncbi:unnamed protein product [Closterium sp. NIES-54]
MLVPDALTIHPRVYLKSLWGACVRFAREAAAGSSPGTHARLVLASLPSLAALASLPATTDSVGSRASSGSDSSATSSSGCDSGGGSGGSGGSSGGSSSSSSFPFDIVFVCMGAHTLALPEVAPHLSSFSLSRGHILHLSPPLSSQSLPSSHPPSTSPSTTLSPPSPPSSPPLYPASAPSLLGSTWVSARAPHRIVVGATNHNLPLPPVPSHPKESAHIATHSPTSMSNKCSSSRTTTTTNTTPSTPPFTPFPPPPPDEIAAASATLVTSLTSLLPALSSWEIVRSVTGIRAMPPRSSLGRVPVAGRVEGVVLGVVGGGGEWGNGHGEEVKRGSALGGSEGAVEEGVEDGGVAGVEDGSVAPAAPPGPSVWIVGGLGSRGLIYHGWVAKHAAAAAVGGDEGLLPPELLWWKQQGEKSKVERRPGKEPRRNDGRKGGRGGKSDSG